MSTTNFITTGATGSKSEEGVIQWVVPYYVKGKTEIQTVGGSLYEGCSEVSRTWTCNNDGPDPSYIVTVTYEGGSESSQNATYGDDDATVWSLDFEMAEEPIQSHWNWEKIKKTYGWTQDVDGIWGFPEKLPAGSSETAGLGGKSKVGSADANPMYGKSIYVVMNCLASVSYSKKTLPTTVINTIGQLYRNIPGAPSQFNSLDKGKRNWMKMPPQISKRGNTWQITESWRLSEYYEWPKEVYSDGNAGNFN